MVGVGRGKGDCSTKSEGYLLLLHENRVFQYITASLAVLWNVQ